eukprot:2556975-Amphidinium_carterae.1
MRQCACSTPYNGNYIEIAVPGGDLAACLQRLSNIAWGRVARIVGARIGIVISGTKFRSTPQVVLPIVT